MLGYDVTQDVAVLQLEGGDLGAATTAGGGPGLGDPVTAVGDAGGDGGTLTAAPGTVTDLHHAITVQDDATGASSRLHNLIEVSSDVVPGDSGGALLDSSGEVVGMTVAASTGGTDVTGYVIPIGRVLDVVDQVLGNDDSGTVELGHAAFLGVQLATVDAAAPTLARVLDASPADELGLVAGDTVTAIDGTPVGTAQALRQEVAGHEPGDRVTVTWIDGSGAAHTGTATLVAGPVG